MLKGQTVELKSDEFATPRALHHSFPVFSSVLAFGTQTRESALDSKLSQTLMNQR